MALVRRNIFKLYKSLKRYCSSSSLVRVRFAPSPTGYLHLGGLRTALYNYLFARSNNGRFILRIEDTDRKRLVPGAVEQLEQDLIWAGLAIDEGPSGGGNHGPYVQSERTLLYRQEAERLIENGAAYRCFCTEKRLELLRKDAVRNRQVPKYDNRCRNLTTEEIKEKMRSDSAYCVRLKLIQAEPFDDTVKGTVLHEVMNVEGDPILLKTDGFPTYHLANVVDDHHMQISHVIRGVEWLMSTNKHIMIYRALGFPPPKFAHLPLLMNPDGSKLSKRQGDITVDSFRARGIQPRALLNFITQAGGGFDTVSSYNMSMDDLISKFVLGKVNSNSCKLPMDRLSEFNHLDLVRQISNDEEITELVQKIKPLVKQTVQNKTDQELDLSDSYIKKVLKWSLPRISYLSDLVGQDLLFIWTVPSKDVLIKHDTGLSASRASDILEKVLSSLSRESDFNKQVIGKSLKHLAKEEDLNFKILMVLLRISLSGLKEGPSVSEMIDILGKETSCRRLIKAITLLTPNKKLEVDCT